MKRIKDFHIARTRFFGGIIVGILFSLSFYSILYVTREFIRLASQTKSHDLWVLSESELNFYNIFYALISTIIGQAICFTIWFDKPKAFLSRGNLLLKSVVNDQRNLSWFFVLWFTKLAFLYGVFFGLAIPGGYYFISLYDEYYYLFILIVIVLFMNSWNSLSRILKSNRFIWFLSSLTLVILVSFSISRIQVVDFNSVSEKILDKNIFRKYSILLPQSIAGRRIRNASFVHEIFVVLDKSHPNPNEPIIVVNNAEVQIENLHQQITAFKGEHDLPEIDLIGCKLDIHKNVEMFFVNQVIEKLIEQNITRIWFSVLPNETQFDYQLYRSHGIPFRFPSYKPPFMDLNTVASKSANYSEIEQLKDGSFKFESIKMNSSELKSEIKSHFSATHNLEFKIFVNDKADYQSFTSILSAIRESKYEMRNDYSIKYYNKIFEDLSRVERKLVGKLFVERIFIISEKMKLEIDTSTGANTLYI